jgi:digeranylgeranylglycerophospholipid reductase
LGNDFDIVVAGGSIAGLAFAAEAAKRGVSVLVLEEHHEIGEPEKCDGLVSLRVLRRYGFSPDKNVIQTEIASWLIHSPGGKNVAINAASLDVVVLDRSEYDKQAAQKAVASGARIQTGARVTGSQEREDGVEVSVGSDVHTAKYLVDATGPASSPRRGIIPAAKYEIEAEWVKEHVVEVYLDAQKYPGFFAWVIPCGPKLAKVGVAGRGLSPFIALDSFLASREYKINRKVAAPIYVGGPIDSFVSGRKVFVGESAGLVKATTAGGIVTSVVSSVIAAKWVSESIQTGDNSLVANYQRDWASRFGKEMRNMLRLRGVFEKLSNQELDALSTIFSNPKLLTKLSSGDFDFHATAVLGALGVSGLLRMARVVASAEARSLLVGS